MRIASISLVKDEADILEGFIRHNLHFVDRMYVVDDRSSDNTPEILRRLAAETHAVRVLDDGWTGAFHQARRTSAAFHRIKADADWDVVLALDADEMICCVDRATFEAEIATIPAGAVGGLAEIAYYATATDDSAIIDPLARVHMARIDPNKLPKSFATRPFLNEPSLAFGEGNHDMRTREGPLRTHILKDAALAHFAIRSADQIGIKCLKHYVGWRSRHDYDGQLSSHLIKGAKALGDEPSFTLRPSSGIFDVYLGFDPAEGRERPFVERRGELKWPELAVTTPYVQLLGLLDQLIAQSKAADELQSRFDKFQASPSRLSRAYVRAVGQRLARSFAKRR